MVAKSVITDSYQIISDTISRTYVISRFSGLVSYIFSLTEALIDAAAIQISKGVVFIINPCFLPHLSFEASNFIHRWFTCVDHYHYLPPPGKLKSINFLSQCIQVIRPALYPTKCEFISFALQYFKYPINCWYNACRVSQVDSVSLSVPFAIQSTFHFIFNKLWSLLWLHKLLPSIIHICFINFVLPTASDTY